MIKKKFYVISKKGRYGEDVMHRCNNLEAAMELFKFLVQSDTVELGETSVPDNTRTPDEDGWVSSTYLKYEKGEAEYHIGTEVVTIYTNEEIEKIGKEREEWLKPFKDKAEKSKKVKKKGTKK